MQKKKAAKPTEPAQTYKNTTWTASIHTAKPPDRGLKNVAEDGGVTVTPKWTRMHYVCMIDYLSFAYSVGNLPLHHPRHHLFLGRILWPSQSDRGLNTRRMTERAKKWWDDGRSSFSLPKTNCQNDLGVKRDTKEQDS